MSLASTCVCLTYLIRAEKRDKGDSLFRIPLRSLKSWRKGRAMTFTSGKALLIALTIKGDKKKKYFKLWWPQKFVSKSLPDFFILCKSNIYKNVIM